MSVWAWQDHEQVCGFSVGLLHQNAPGYDRKLTPVPIRKSIRDNLIAGCCLKTLTFSFEAFLSAEKRPFDTESIKMSV